MGILTWPALQPGLSDSSILRGMSSPTSRGRRGLPHHPQRVLETRVWESCAFLEERRVYVLDDRLDRDGDPNQMKATCVELTIAAQEHKGLR